MYIDTCVHDDRDRGWGYGLWFWVPLGSAGPKGVHDDRDRGRGYELLFGFRWGVSMRTETSDNQP